jgi:DNA polymerase-3 subunit delta'
MLRPLAEDDVAAAAAAAAGRSADDTVIREAAAAAEWSVARAVSLGEQTLAVRARVHELLRQLPALDPERLHVLGDSLTRADDQAFRTFLDALRDWLSLQLRAQTHEPHRLARVAQVWEKLDHAARDVEMFNLERKPMVFAAFGMLAEAARSG